MSLYDDEWCTFQSTLPWGTSRTCQSGVGVPGTSTRLAEVRTRNLIFGLIGSAIASPSTVKKYRWTVGSSGSLVALQTPLASLVIGMTPPVADAGVASQSPVRVTVVACGARTRKVTVRSACTSGETSVSCAPRPPRPAAGGCAGGVGGACCVHARCPIPSTETRQVATTIRAFTAPPFEVISHWQDCANYTARARCATQPTRRLQIDARADFDHLCERQIEKVRGIRRIARRYRVDSLGHQAQRPAGPGTTGYCRSTYVKAAGSTPGSIRSIARVSAPCTFGSSMNPYRSRTR